MSIKYPQAVLEPIKKFLIERLFQLEKRKKQADEIDPFKDKTRTTDNAAIDTDAAEQVEHMEASAFRKSYDKMIIQVRKALSRIKLGNYGVCERCGNMIDTDRLMLIPEATLCVTCERKREK